jgi:hypothetical protein
VEDSRSDRCLRRPSKPTLTCARIELCQPIDLAASNWHYILLREDLPTGVALAQACHAASESSQGTEPGTFLIVLGLPDEPAMQKYAKRLRSKDIRFVEFREPDRNNEVTAIGIFPTKDRDALRKVIGHLALWSPK